jgi:uncharacterized protein with HEPN domain
MSRDPQLRLEDILEAGLRIESYIEGFDYESFIKDRRTVDAVIRNLEIIGEAVKSLPEDMTGQFPEIPWRAIAGFRDILAHCYFRTEDAIVWDAAKEHNSALLNAVKQLLGS